MAPARKIIKQSLAEQVREIIKEMIENEEFGESGQMPPEENLASILGVSRITIRDALANLELGGYIFRIHGKGTFANYRVAKIKSRLSYATEFTRLIKESGFVPSVGHCQVKKILAGHKTAQKLDCSVGDEIFLIEKLFLADSSPAVYCTNAIHAKFLDDSILGMNLEQPVFDLLSVFQFPPIAYDIVEIIPITADQKYASLLSCPLNSPLLLLEAIVYEKNQTPLMFNKEVYHNQFIRFSEVRTTNYR